MSSPSFQTAFVTGATGFIGERLCLALAEAGVEVRALVRTPAKAETIAQAGVTTISGDVMSPATYVEALRGVEVVFHLAGVLKAPWRESFARTNGHGPRVVAEACAAVSPSPALVVVSSLAAAGPVQSGTPRNELMPLEPISIYGRAKLAGEQGLEEYSQRLSMAVLRPPMVFGAGDQAALGLFRLADRGLGVLPTWRENRLSLVHVDDVVGAMMAMGDGARRRESGPIDAYFIGADEQPTFSELAHRIARACGHEGARVLRLPRGLTFLAAFFSHWVARVLDRPAILNLDKYREAVAGDWTCDPGKLTRDLGWRPAHSLDERLLETVRGYRENGLLKKR